MLKERCMTTKKLVKIWCMDGGIDLHCGDPTDIFKDLDEESVKFLVKEKVGSSDYIIFDKRSTQNNERATIVFDKHLCGLVVSYRETF